MTFFSRGFSVAWAGLLAFGAGLAAPPARGEVALAAHRAIYDLKLQNVGGKRPVQSVRGRIVYDFSGTACEGYALQYRQVTELDSGEGPTMLSDIRSSTWEDGTSSHFKYMFRTFLDSRVKDLVEGSAERQDKGVAARLTKPRERRVELGEVTFPTGHIRKIIRAAEAGEKTLEAAVYDGSDNGEKVYDTLAVIGPKIVPGTKPPQDAAGGKDGLSTLARWPVSLSYFDQGKGGREGEQTPIYSIAFELYENGISRALQINYGDFSVTGEMTSLELSPSTPCR